MMLQRTLLAAAALAATLTLAGCWGDNDDDGTLPPPVVSNEVPDSAGLGTAAFVSYLLSLSGSDETSEPSILKDGFAVPADEGGEPTPLT